MSDAEILAKEIAAMAFPESEFRRDRCMTALRSYGRLVQESAAKESAKPKHGVSAWKCRENITKAIREMPLP